MPSTYSQIASTTVGTATPTVSFNTISGSYTDLILVISAKGSVQNYPRLRFNGDTGTNYSRTILSGNGSAAQSARGTNDSAANINYNSSTNTTDFAYISITHLMNYSNSTTYKTQISRANNASNGVDAIVTMWRSTAAITSIECSLNTGNYDVGSVLSLYGIKAA